MKNLIGYQVQNKLADAYRLCLLVGGLYLLFGGHNAIAEEPQSLPATIEQGISLLENQKYEAFLIRIPVPEELERMRKNRSMEEIARTFSKQHAPRLLGMLNQIKDEKPVISDEGRRAEYNVDWKNFSRKKLVFLQISGRWHLHN